MKVLFIIKDFVVEPLGIMYLSSALKKAGHQTDLVKADLENVEEKVRTFSPDIIGYSITTGQHKYFTELNLKLKNKFRFIALFGGAHPTFFNEFIKEKGVDIISIGESEQAIVDLANKMEQGEDFRNIPNLWVKDRGEFIKNQVRSLVNVNSIAFPDRELIYSRYPKSYNNPIKNFIGGRGCPYNCSFCFNHCLKKIYQDKGQYVRFLSVDNLLKEILEVKNNYPLRMVYFQDDTFATQINWLEEFSEKYPKIINLSFHCHIRVNLVSERFINLLKRAGCYGVSFAIETADDYLRNQVLRKNISREQIIKAAKLIKKAGIRLRIYNILGLPRGSLDSDLETLELNILCQPDLGWASIYQPYSKTELGDLCIKMGIYDGNIDKMSESFFEETVLNIPDKDKINNLQKLFALVVSFPFLKPLIRILISFPPNILYKKFYYFWKKRLYKKIYNL